MLYFPPSLISWFDFQPLCHLILGLFQEFLLVVIALFVVLALLDWYDSCCPG